MVSDSVSHWRSLGGQSSTLFFAAGTLLTVYAALNGIAAFTDVAYPAVENVVGPAGFVLGLLGLLGLYPMLTHRSPRLAHTGAAFAALGAVGFSVVTGQGLVRLTGADPPSLLGIFVIVAAVGMVPGFLAFGAATVRTGVHSRALGLLLLAPATIFAVMASQAVLFTQLGVFSETVLVWSAVAISGGQALAHLAIGYALETGFVPSEHETPASDVTAG